MRAKTNRILRKWLALALVLCITITGLQMGGVKALADSESESEPSLKAAILSDIHVGFTYEDGTKQAKWLEYVLKWYKEQGVDTVIIPGDIVNGYSGGSLSSEQSKKDWEEFVAVWNKVFPEKKGENGYVERIMIYGNHDKYLSGVLTDNTVSLDINEAWKNVNEEDFSPVYSKKVGGYWFVCVHESLEAKNVSELEKQLKAAVEASNGAPVFYIQHCPMYQTTGCSDGSDYGDVKTGYNVAKNYENVVALTGHTHRPITDERSIWQGNEWEDGKFTTIACATLNYGGVENGRINGNAQHVKHGMLMTANGNDITINRYNFYTEEMLGLVTGTDENQDFEKCVTSAGKDWSFTVGGEKLYAYDARYEASAVPEFADGAVATVTTGDTSATITFPKAAMPEGGLFESYVVEARDPGSGIIKATGMVNTEYHIDADIATRYSDTYSVTVTGLKQDAEYDFYVYGRNFLGKCTAAPLKVTGKTTGTRTSGEQGDVNDDYYTDVRDLAALKKNGETAKNKDVDENGVEDMDADMHALRRLLLGYSSAVIDSANDLIGQSTYQKCSYDASKQGYGHETKTVSTATAGFEDSKEAFEFWAVNTSSNPYPYVILWFDESQDWSKSNTLNFDTKFVDQNNIKWYEIRLVSGEQKVYSNELNINAAQMDWTTKSIPLKEFTNVDWTNVKGVRFLLNYDSYAGRYDGTTKSSFFVDNMHASYEIIPDSDLLSHYKSGITYTGASLEIANGDTASMSSCEAHKLVLNGDSATMDIPVSGNPSRLDTISVSAKLSAGTLTVQAYDQKGELVGKAKTLNANSSKWTDNTFKAEELDYHATVAGYRFTVTGAAKNDVLLLDDLAVTYQECASDTDYFATGTVSGSGFQNKKTDWEIQPYTTSGSNAAVHAWRDSTQASGYPAIVVELPEAVDMTELDYISYDVRYGADTHWWYGYQVCDVNGKWSAEGGGNTGVSSEWKTVNIPAAKINFASADKTQIKKIKIIVNFDTKADIGVLCDVWFDNLNIILKETDDLLSAGNVSWSAGSFAMNNPSYGMLQIQNGFTNGSRQALKISTEAATIKDEWPYFWVELPDGISLNKDTTLSIDGWCSDSFHPWISFKFYDKSGTQISDEKSIDFYENGDYVHNRWQTETRAVSGWTIKDDYTIKDVSSIKITLNLNKNNGTAREAYLDNFKLSGYTEEKPDDDMLSQVQTTYVNDEKMKIDKTGAEYAHGSSLGYCITVASGATGWPYAQLVGPDGYWDMSKADTLQMDVKLDGEISQVAVKLQYIDDDGNWRVTRWERTLSLADAGDGWSVGTINLADFDKYDTSLGKLSSTELSRVRSIMVYVMIGSNKTTTAESRIYIDNMKLPTATETALFVGDSITAAIKDEANKSGWAGRIAAEYNMVCVNAGVSGASVSTVRENRIISQLEAYKGKTYDYVILHGGVNDAMGAAAVGTISEDINETSFSTDTFAGALEELFCYAKKIEGAKLGYIINYVTPNSTWGGNTKDMSEYVAVAKKACAKWNIPYIDLYEGFVEKDGKKYFIAVIF